MSGFAEPGHLQLPKVPAARQCLVDGEAPLQGQTLGTPRCWALTRLLPFRLAITFRVIVRNYGETFQQGYLVGTNRD